MSKYPEEKGAGKPHMAEAVGASQLSKKAVISLVLGITSFVCTFFTGFAAVILGILSLNDIAKRPGRLEGKGLAIAGIVTGCVGSLLTIPLLIALLLPAVQQVREAARRTTSMNNMRQLSLSMHNYESAYKQLPPSGQPFGEGLSWRVHVLPFLDQLPLYEEFHLDEPWDSTHNIQLIERMPAIFDHPKLELPPGQTVYVVPVTIPESFENWQRDRSMFVVGERSPTLSRISDGLSNTVMLLEVDESASVPWTKPNADWIFNPNDPVHSVGNVWHGIFLVGFADGSAHAVTDSIDPEAFKAMVTRAGGELTPASF